ncbi:MAG TPA: erythromycin esterase family protein [Gemmatimonadaceae bacterium]|nr:erythromycin esterase family protein [Gemmatimonadaceae bacterium]
MRISPSTFLCTLAALLAPVGNSAAQQPRELHARDSFDSTLSPGVVHDYRLRLQAGESANLVVTQMGVDVVVEVRNGTGTLVSTIDSPNGRNGPEPVEIVADKGDTYALRVRPFDNNEPAGKYHLEIVALRSAAATSAMMRARRLARDSATAWLARRSAAIPASGRVPSRDALPPLDSLAMQARVVGIGEATHGSREFSDLRLAITRRLVQRNGYRIVAIEASTSRLAILNRYIAGEIAAGSYVTAALESGWIGRRAQRELLPWLRQWNVEHPNDRVELVGLDPQDNFTARDSLRAFLTRAYGSELTSRLAPMFAEFAAADSQTLVFADSRIDSTTRRSIVELIARLDLDAPALISRFGRSQVESASTTARHLAQFAEFNSNGNGFLNRSRDYYMAANLIDALNRAGPNTKALYWAHNTHVAHPVGQSVNARTAGAWLRDWLGCGYRSIAISFGEGSFVAQLPNDLTDRLAASTLPASPEESIDAVLGAIRKEATIAAWPCSVDSTSVPNWLTGPHPMHWVGALFTPGSPPTDAFRPFDLVRAFDGVVYFARVTADEMPQDRPLIPARKR